MDVVARRALATIRRCIAGERYNVSWHFTRRMDKRGLVWPDVMTVLDAPADVREDGLDDRGRDKWLVRGHTADGLVAELVCAIGRERAGAYTVFITIYWMEELE